MKRLVANYKGNLNSSAFQDWDNDGWESNDAIRNGEDYYIIANDNLLEGL